MLMARPTLVIFQCDGVIIDNDAAVFSCVAEALTAEGLALDMPGAWRRFAGRTLAEIAEMAAQDLGRTLPAEWPETVEAAVVLRLRAGVKPVPYAVETLRAIRAGGIKLAAMSAGSLARVSASIGMTGLLPLFLQRLFGAMEAGGQLGCLQYIARIESLVGSRVAVVDNSTAGIARALSLGMTAIGFAGDPRLDGQAMQAAGAMVVDDLRNVLPMLRLPALPRAGMF